ncbi:hypothetical protein [Enterovibrio norvegicus]|uniref:hypothetical protein n=1 Tax=Enterovibrio norvegicus TaxID=188144 RepID=UPI000C86767D|nr:hypothetical protein [Enterovibrio norvegicus]PMH68375.1 hypothetical protein BCU62_00680 [Enterovibrio norvegicus]
MNSTKALNCLVLFLLVFSFSGMSTAGEVAKNIEPSTTQAMEKQVESLHSKQSEEQTAITNKILKLLENQQREMIELKAQISNSSQPLSTHELLTIKKELIEFNEEKSYFSYADWAAISVSSVSVIVTVVALLIAILSFIGFQSMKKVAVEEAAKAASNAAEKKIQEVAAIELTRIIDEGRLNDHLRHVIDVVVLRERDKGATINADDLLAEIDKDMEAA